MTRNLLLVQILLASLVATGSAIRCYICRSVDADMTTITLEEMQQIFTHMPLPDRKSNVPCTNFNEDSSIYQIDCPHTNHCMKLSGKMLTPLGQDTRVEYRGCFQEGTHTNDKSETCTWKDKLLECTCPYDLCNKASRQDVLFLTLALLFLCGRILGY